MCSGHKVERSEEVTTPSGLCPARADREREMPIWLKTIHRHKEQLAKNSNLGYGTFTALDMDGTHFNSTYILDIRYNIRDCVTLVFEALKEWLRFLLLSVKFSSMN